MRRGRRCARKYCRDEGIPGSPDFPSGGGGIAWLGDDDDDIAQEGDGSGDWEGTTPLRKRRKGG